jgi:hypothetical protein
MVTLEPGDYACRVIGIYEAIGATVGAVVGFGDSSSPMSRRKGGYVSVISDEYAATRKTQRFMPITKS